MKTFARKFLSVTLAAMMLLSMLPTVAFAANSSDDFYRIVHLDNGRKYYSKEWIIALINEMAEAGFNQLQLAFGNDGMRFLLDDMEITVDGTTYFSDAVTEGIQEGNKAYYDEDVNELTEEEMDEILAHADSMGIEIVPHMNMPGHMDAILDAIEYVGISNAHFTGYTTSVRSLNLNNSSAVNFTLALLSKYVDYFADNGCGYFHIGADEFGNDAYGGSMGFPSMGRDLYAKFADFVNNAAAIVKDAGMTPRAWNDGISYGNGNSQSTTNYSEEFDTDIQVTYWSSGWGSGYAVAPASTLANNGHDMINTNGDYYYILGVNDTYTSGNSATHVGYDYTAAEGFENTTFMGTSGLEGVGSMFCIWGDYPGAETEQEVAKYVRPILRVMGARMNDSNDYEVESIVAGGFNEDGSINEGSEIVDPEVPVVPEDVAVPAETELGTVTITAPGLEEVNVSVKDVDSDDETAWLTYSISVSGQLEEYTDLKFKVPYHEIFDECDLDTLVADVDGDEVEDLAIEEDETGKYFVGTAPHFSDLTFTATVDDKTVTGSTIDLYVGQTAEILVSETGYDDNVSVGDEAVADFNATNVEIEGESVTVLGNQITPSNTSGWSAEGVFHYNGNYLTVSSTGALGTTTEITEATVFTVARSSNNSYTIKAKGTNYYVIPKSGGWNSYSLGTSTSSSNWKYNSGFYAGSYGTYYYLKYSNGWTLATGTAGVAQFREVTTTTTDPVNNTKIVVTGEGVGTTNLVVTNDSGDEVANYTINVRYYEESKTVTANGVATDTLEKDFENGDTIEYLTETDEATRTITASVNNSVVTFTASEDAEVGTEVKILVGNTLYTVTVTELDLSAITPLTVEFWITNNQVTTDKGVSMQIQASDAYSEEGVLVSALIPATGTWSNNPMAYWKTTCLGSDHHQNDDSGVNQTLSGNDFKYIRYWNGAWEYSADGEEWTAVLSDDQIVAYYMQVTEVTKEVETQVVDWGELYGNWFNDANYILVDYAVKYESGERVPDAFPISGVTQKFHCNADDNNVAFGNVVKDNNTNVYYRNLWSIRVLESIEYEVYMVTVTPTADRATEYLSSGANSEATGQENFYAGTEKVLWVDDEANLGDFADESLRYTSISGDVTYHVGGEPVITELEIYNRHGMLVTYYVRAKANEDALTVHYIDKTDLAGNVEFYTYNIAVKEGTLFSDQIALDKNNWKGNLVNGTVQNYFGKDQTVSTDLSTLSQIGAQYLYTDYVCDEVKVSDNNKEVFLYYTFKPYVHLVLDFGAPVVISAADLSEKISDDLVEDMFFSGTSSTKYGTLTDNGTTITYALKDVLNGTDFFTLVVKTNEYVNVTGDAAKQVAFRVYVHPASNVLYEETFMDQKSTGVNWTVGGDETGAATEQDKPVADSAPYGYDSNYATSTGTSGSTYTANLASGELTKNLTVDFTGTGFDLIGTSSPETGYVYLVITGDATKAVIVDTSHSSKTLYQVPLAHLELDEGDYTATVFGTYREAIEASGTGVVAVYDTETQKTNVMTTAEGAAITANPGTLVEIDGFRVYSSSTNTAFVEEEQGVQYGNILHGGFIESGFAAYVDNSSDGTYTVADYESSGGPQNEVYLAPGQSIAMYVSGGAVQVSLRSVEGVTVTAHISNGVTENGDQVTSKEINHSTEMYYEVTPSSEGYLTIKNADGGLLAVGNVKYKPAATSFMALGADNWVSLFSLLDEEPVFTPETFDVEIGSVKLFSKKVTTMTITASLDVEYLKVNGKKVKPVNSWMVKRGLDDEYVFVITKTSKRNADVSFDVVAYDATGMASDVYTIEE